MNNRHLFLFGGGPPFNEKLGEVFASYSLKENGKVGLLLIEREGWKEYMPRYTSLLEDHGLKNFVYLPLSLSPEMIIKELNSCTGVIICGGETERYRDLIVDTAVGKYIKEMYQSGIPVAGFSAGALISPNYCVIPPIDNSKGKSLYLAGLGLVSDCVISVHFSEWDEKDNLHRAIERMNVLKGYGIDQDSGLYFQNEDLAYTEGNIHIVDKATMKEE